MNEERDFAGFVLPFAAGIYSVTGSDFAVSACATAASTTFLALTAFLLACIMHPRVRSGNPVLQRMAVLLLGFCCGGFTGSCDAIMSICQADYTPRAEALCHLLGESIDRLEFYDRSTNAVIKALVTGDRSDIPASVTEAFRESGASHILALSGFHLGIIYGIASWLLSWTGGNRIVTVIKSLVIITLCGIYTLSAGAGASIVRAFIFIAIRETARITHRQATTSTALLSSLVVQLAADPTSIRSVSFQLSYAAMAGIACIFPYLKGFWPSDDKEEARQWPLLKKIWSSASLSISCQLTTGPLAWIYFRSFPRHFLLTNLLALPITGILIPSVILTIALTWLGICPDIMTRAVEMLVTALTTALEIISDM